MDLTRDNKTHIDSLALYQLLHAWRFTPVGDPWFQGETGEYWGNRISELKKEDPENFTKTSKEIGWGP